MVGIFNSLSKVFLICLLLLSACTVKTEITMGPDDIITIRSKKDALVTVADKDRTVTVNNQGKPTLFESIITMMFMRTQVGEEGIKEGVQ